MSHRDRILAATVSGPLGRVVALIADLVAALTQGARSRLRGR